MFVYIALLLWFCFSATAFPLYEDLKEARSVYNYVKSPGDATYDYVSLGIAGDAIFQEANYQTGCCWRRYGRSHGRSSIG
jgi:hypothetical protein